MAFNVAVIKDSGSAVLHGARVESITAQGATCLELITQDSDRDGILIMNRDAAIEVGVTLIANPDGLPDATVVLTSEAWASRIARIAANTTELIDVKAGTRVLLSTSAGTPQIAWQEVNA